MNHSQNLQNVVYMIGNVANILYTIPVAYIHVHVTLLISAYFKNAYLSAK
jgi:hypothetical protein